VAYIGNLSAVDVFSAQMPSSHQTKITPPPTPSANQIQALRRFSLTPDCMASPFVVSRKKTAGGGVDGGFIVARRVPLGMSGANVCSGIFGECWFKL